MMNGEFENAIQLSRALLFVSLNARGKGRSANAELSFTLSLSLSVIKSSY